MAQFLRLTPKGKREMDRYKNARFPVPPDFGERDERRFILAFARQGHSTRAQILSLPRTKERKDLVEKVLKKMIKTGHITEGPEKI